MRTVSLTQSIKGAYSLDIRAPGVAIVERIISIVGDDGQLPGEAVPRLASRLSGISEATIARLPANDLTAIRHAIEGLFHQEARRIKLRRNSGA